jgi:hypothetical protein
MKKVNGKNEKKSTRVHAAQFTVQTVAPCYVARAVTGGAAASRTPRWRLDGGAMDAASRAQAKRWSLVSNSTSLG